MGERGCFEHMDKPEKEVNTPKEKGHALSSEETGELPATPFGRCFPHPAAVL